LVTEQTIDIYYLEDTVLEDEETRNNDVICQLCSNLEWLVMPPHSERPKRDPVHRPKTSVNVTEVEPFQPVISFPVTDAESLGKNGIGFPNGLNSPTIDQDFCFMCRTFGCNKSKMDTSSDWICQQEKKKSLRKFNELQKSSLSPSHLAFCLLAYLLSYHTKGNKKKAKNNNNNKKKLSAMLQSCQSPNSQFLKQPCRKTHHDHIKLTIYNNHIATCKAFFVIWSLPTL